MERTTIVFFIWCIGGIFYMGLAVYIWFSKKAVAIWGNANMFEVTDIRKYNHAVSKLYVVYSIVFILLGLPLLAGYPKWIFLAVAGVVMETIVLTAVYSLVIKKKYEQKEPKL